MTTPLFTGQAAHIYTAVATQVNAVSEAEGVSEPRNFEVSTLPRRCTINALHARLGIKESRPAFAGAASDPKEEVTVRLYKGLEAIGEPVATGTAPVNSGRWTAPALRVRSEKEIHGGREPAEFDRQPAGEKRTDAL